MAMVTHEVRQCIAQTWEKNVFLRLCCGTVFLGIPALAGGLYGDKCVLSMCLLETSGHGPEIRNVAAGSIRHRQALS